MLLKTLLVVNAIVFVKYTAIFEVAVPIAHLQDTLNGIQRGAQNSGVGILQALVGAVEVRMRLNSRILLLVLFSLSASCRHFRPLVGIFGSRGWDCYMFRLVGSHASLLETLFLLALTDLSCSLLSPSSALFVIHSLLEVGAAF
mgnify:CR=1 FL=1